MTKLQMARACIHIAIKLKGGKISNYKAKDITKASKQALIGGNYEAIRKTLAQYKREARRASAET